ncbi:GHKL domain-containing protein, partial [bacterium]|nr:GHKL domain-containing protein [bacterium]
MKNTVLPSTFKERFEKAKQEEFKSRKEKEFLEVLNKWLVIKLRLDTTAQGSEASGFKHFYENIYGEHYQIAYTPIYEGERYAGILGFKIALDYIRSEILAKALSSLILSDNLTISVLDETGKPIYGPNPASTKSITSENFSSIFPFWKISILQTGGISIQDMAKKQSQVYIALMVLMIAFICIGTCLTLRNILREIQLSRMKSDFVSNVSHELKTPLALIRLFGETLEMGRVETKEKAQEYYRVIIRECERLTQLINNVLNFSRIDSKKEHYEFEYVDMAGVVQDAVDTYKFQLDKEGFKVETKIDRDIPMALIDKDAISQVISNLVDNAIKFSKDEKKLTVNLKREEKSILIEVIDSGVGINEKEQKKIFDKFYRVRDELAGEAKGSGLGLTLVKHIVEAHKGKIT